MTLTKFRGLRNWERNFRKALRTLSPPPSSKNISSKRPLHDHDHRYVCSFSQNEKNYVSTRNPKAFQRFKYTSKFFQGHCLRRLTHGVYCYRRRARNFSKIHGLLHRCRSNFSKSQNFYIEGRCLFFSLNIEFPARINFV